MTQCAQSSTSALHRLWARLENEHHELALAIERAGSGGPDVARMRARQARLLLQINAVVAEIRKAPATTLEDYAALLDVALEHEIDLAADMAFYGPADYPMIIRLLRALAEQVPGFEFNSLGRWLSPGQFEQAIGRAGVFETAAKPQTSSNTRIRRAAEQDRQAVDRSAAGTRVSQPRATTFVLVSSQTDRDDRGGGDRA